MTNVPIRLCSVQGDQFELLPHFLDHYRSLGIQQFDIILHIRDISQKHRLTKVLESYGIRPVDYLLGEWNGAINTEAINNYKSKFPDDWFLVADSDEFHLYPCSLNLVIDSMIKAREQFATGCLLDRIAENGALKAVHASQSIWRQFPYTGFISSPLMGANPYKVTLSKGNIHLSEGQHGILSPHSPYPVTGNVVTQVHHFKWTRTVIERLKLRQTSIENGHWENAYKAYGYEIHRLFEYLEKRKLQFDINEPFFLLSRTENSYYDYSNWAKIKAIVSNWSALQSYRYIA